MVEGSVGDFVGAIGALGGDVGVLVGGILGDASVGFSRLRRRSKALLIGVPGSRKGVISWGIFKACVRFLIATVSWSVLVVSGMVNWVGSNLIVSTGIVALVCGMKTM